jgi:hypothetical protein
VASGPENRRRQLVSLHLPLSSDLLMSRLSPIGSSTITWLCCGQRSPCHAVASRGFAANSNARLPPQIARTGASSSPRDTHEIRNPLPERELLEGYSL